MVHRDHWATLRALLNMTVARGCTPHEAEVALSRANVVAARLGTTLDAFRRSPPSDGPPSTWARTAQEKREARQRDYERRQAEAKRREEERQQAEAKRYEAEAWRRWREATVRDSERYAARQRFRRDGDRILQPAWRELLNLLRQDTWTAAELGDVLRLEPHTVRAMISRMRKAGVEINTTKRGRETAYNSPAT